MQYRLHAVRADNQNHADEGLLSEAVNIYKENGGNIRATADAIKDRVSSEDMSSLYELYEKYADEISEEDFPD